MTLESATTALAAAVLPTVVTGGIGFLAKNAFGGMRASIADLIKEVKELNTRLSGHDTRIETVLVRLAALEKEQERQSVRHHELAGRFHNFALEKAVNQ